MFCLWHVFKNVVKNCAKAFADKDERADMLRLFRSAAYAATPEVKKRTSFVFSVPEQDSDVSCAIIADCTPLNTSSA